MQSEKYKRDTVFLYPDLEKMVHGEREKTLNLIAQLTAIVNTANRTLMELVEGGSFSFVNCLPMVQMQCVSDMAPNFTDRENVRICIVKLDEYDYMTNYENLIQEYLSGKTEISHLVALNIVSHQQKVLFSEDKNKSFDTLITTSLDYLETVLVSIMFDISVYHYYGLSNKLSERKKFNKVKFEYLRDKYTKKDQEEIYGNPFPESSLYLPISLPEVKVIDRRTKSESRQNAVREMLKDYSTFLAKSSLAIKIATDEDGSIMVPYPDIPKEIFPDLEKWTHEKKEMEKYVVIFFKDSTDHYESDVVEYDDEDEVPCWIKKSSEGKFLYKIITVKREQMK